MSTPEDNKGSRRGEPSPEDRARGQRIAGRRHALEVEQPFIADAVGVSRSQVSLWENGRAMPTGANMTRLARVLRTTPEYILTGEGPIEARSGSGSASAVGIAHTEGAKAGDRHTAVVRGRVPEYIPIDEEGRPLLDEIDQLMEWLPEGMSRRFVRHVTRRVRLGELYAYGIEQGWSSERLDRIDAARKALDRILDEQDQQEGGGGG